MTDIILIFILVILIGVYFVTVSKRKKKESHDPIMDVSEESSEVALLRKQHHVNLLKKKTHREVETHLVDYSVYTLSIKQYILYATLAAIVFGFIGYLFYESIIAAIILAACGLLYPKIQKKALLERRKEQLNLQFKEAISSLSSSLAAGRSIENAFLEVVEDLYLLYPDPNTYIIREFDIINRRVENGETIENAILDFSIRSDIDDVQNFSDVFITCKRTGGNLVEVIRRTSDIIGEKISIQQEVSVMLAQKRFESKIMSVAPLGMILLLKYSAGDYLNPMYEWGTAGPIVMTICLGILAFSYWYGQRIMNIKV